MTCSNIDDAIYTYDKNNRLIKIVEPGTSHDTTDGWAVNSRWETALEYDNNGNLKKSTMTSDNGYNGSTVEYTYNAWGQLTKYSDNLHKTGQYTYYSDGLRASKTVGSDTTKYYYNGDDVINETLNGNSYATNVLGVNGYVSRKQSGTTGYLFKNAHGDVLAAYSSTTSKLADYTYDAWGKTRSETETSSFKNNPLRYCGEYYDYENGMTYLRARYYDSGIRRFITEDPIKDGLNWYAYAGNNPVMFVDPSGLELQITGITDWFMKNLRDLSQDTIGDPDEYGFVTISSYHDNPDAATLLVRRIINDPQLCILTSAEADNCTSLPYVTSYFKEDSEGNLYENSGGTVTVNLNTLHTAKVALENGETEITPEHIGLAHELIHILRAMGGYHKNDKVEYKGKMTKVEELENTGLSFYYNNGRYVNAGEWVTTENAIRDIFGLPRRSRYFL